MGRFKVCLRGILLPALAAHPVKLQRTCQTYSLKSLGISLGDRAPDAVGALAGCAFFAGRVPQPQFSVASSAR